MNGGISKEGEYKNFCFYEKYFFYIQLVLQYLGALINITEDFPNGGVNGI